MKIKTYSVLALFIGIMLVSCKEEKKIEVLSTADIAAESEKVNAFFEKQFKENLDRHPMYQTYLGVKKDADKWNDISDDFAKTELKETKKALSWMSDSVNVKALNKGTKLSYDLFKQQLENQIADF